MLSRTWVKRASLLIASSFSACPCSGERGNTSNHSSPSSASLAAVSGRAGAAASSEHDSGKFPRKWFVSTVTARITPGMPSRTMHQSCPGSRRRRVSQPSIHFPRVVYFPSTNTPRPDRSRFSLGAKNSSFAITARTPTRAAARSIKPGFTRSSPPPNPLPPRAAWKPPALVHARPPQKRPQHDARQPAPGVRRDRVTMMQPRGVDGKGRIGVPDDEVGVAPRRDPALAVAYSGQAGGAGGEPARQLLRAVSPRPLGGPRGGQQQLERGDAAPRREEVAGLEALQRGGGGGVVAREEVDDPAGEPVPQSLAVLPLADRGGALERRGAVRDLLGGEREIVRAGLDGDRQPRRPRPRQGVERARRGEMHDVHGAAGGAAQLEHERDRLVL